MYIVLLQRAIANNPKVSSIFSISAILVSISAIYYRFIYNLRCCLLP